MVTAALALLGLPMMLAAEPGGEEVVLPGRPVDDPVPLIANSFGWIFTEMGRQPWVVYSQMLTSDGVSPLVGPGLVLTSMVVLTLLYLALAVVEVGLIVRYAKAGPPETEAEAKAPIEPPERDAGRSDDEHRDDEHRRRFPDDEQAERPLTFAY